MTAAERNLGGRYRDEWLVSVALECPLSSVVDDLARS